MNPRVTTLFVTYNSREVVEATLAAAKRCHDAGLARCVLVDNASKDGTADFVREAHPWVRLIASDENLGFGRGNNLGFAEVDTPFTLFLNPDAAMEPEDLSLLLAFMDAHPRCGASAPSALMPSGHHHTCGKLPSPWRIILDSAVPQLARGHSLPLIPGDPPFQVEWFPGAAMFYRSEFFRSRGGFDPRFFLYFEETDLLRRTREAGWELWTVSEAVIDHVGGASTRKMRAEMYEHCIAEHYFQSRLYYLAKHHGRTQALLTEGVELLALAARSVPQMLRRREPALKSRLAGPIFSMPPP